MPVVSLSSSLEQLSYLAIMLSSPPFLPVDLYVSSFYLFHFVVLGLTIMELAFWLGLGVLLVVWRFAWWVGLLLGLVLWLGLAWQLLALGLVFIMVALMEKRVFVMVLVEVSWLVELMELALVVELMVLGLIQEQLASFS